MSTDQQGAASTDARGGGGSGGGRRRLVALVAIGALVVVGAVAAVVTTAGSSTVAPADASRLVLEPDDGTDGSPDPDLLDAAAAFLGARVDADVTVDADDGSIVVDLGDRTAGADLVAELTRPGAAQLRPVVAVRTPGDPARTWPAASSTEPSWAGDAEHYATEPLGSLLDATDCTAPAPGAAPDADEGAVVCAQDGSAAYLLGAAVLSRTTSPR